MLSIPPMTDPLSRYWHQPPTSEIQLDSTHALMSPAAFETLPEYNGSYPSGVYCGKMWKRHEADWLLMWYGESSQPDRCTVNYRRILIVG